MRARAERESLVNPAGASTQSCPRSSAAPRTDRRATSGGTISDARASRNASGFGKQRAGIGSWGRGVVGSWGGDKTNHHPGTPPSLYHITSQPGEGPLHIAVDSSADQVLVLVQPPAPGRAEREVVAHDRQDRLLHQVQVEPGVEVAAGEPV